MLNILHISRRLSWLVNGDGANHTQVQYYLGRVFELFQFYYILVTGNGIFFVKLQICCIFIRYQNKYIREGVKSNWRGLYTKGASNNIFLLSIRLGEWLLLPLSNVSMFDKAPKTQKCTLNSSTSRMADKSFVIVYQTISVECFCICMYWCTNQCQPKFIL